ncbi:hypothetical protein JZ751_000931, partial [Albula glossodonta]
MAAFTMRLFLCVAVLSGITLSHFRVHFHPWYRFWKPHRHHHGLRLFRGTCPSGWFSHNKRCFQFVSYKTQWVNAERKCQNMGGNLASIHSEAEHLFLKRLFRKFSRRSDPFWLGLSDCYKEGWWFWSDGSKVEYTRWNRNEPNNHGGREHCLHTNFGPKRMWNDINCNDAYSFICARANP